jgi:hypothetical protein
VTVELRDKPKFFSEDVRNLSIEKIFAFHAEEFRVLKGEILALAMFGQNLLFYTVGGVVAYYSWLFTNVEKVKKTNLFWDVLLGLPFVAVSISGLLGASAFFAIQKLGGYIYKLEIMFALDDTLGWEHHSKPRRVRGRSHILGSFANLSIPMWCALLAWGVLWASTFAIFCLRNGIVA